jgi:hypothetical protein
MLEFAGLMQILETIRHFFLVVAQFLVDKIHLPFSAENIVTVLFLAVSIYISSKIIKNGGIWVVGLAGLFFYILQFFGK